MSTTVFRSVQARLGALARATPPHALNALGHERDASQLDQASIDRFSRILPGWLTEGSVCQIPANPVSSPKEATK